MTADKDQKQNQKVTGTTRQTSEVVKKARRRNLRMMIEEKNSAVSTVVVGVVVIFFIFTIGIGLIILGGVYENPDLYIVGAIFTVSGVVFVVLFIIATCTPFLKNRKIHAQLDREIEQMKDEKPTALSPAQYTGEYDTQSNVSFY